MKDQRYKEGYAQCKADMAQELKALARFYYDNGKTNGGDALRHACAVLKTLKNKRTEKP